MSPLQTGLTIPAKYLLYHHITPFYNPHGHLFCNNFTWLPGYLSLSHLASTKMHTQEDCGLAMVSMCLSQCLVHSTCSKKMHQMNGHPPPAIRPYEVQRCLYTANYTNCIWSTWLAQLVGYAIPDHRVMSEPYAGSEVTLNYI